MHVSYVLESVVAFITLILKAGSFLHSNTASAQSILKLASPYCTNISIKFKWLNGQCLNRDHILVATTIRVRDKKLSQHNDYTSVRRTDIRIQGDETTLSL